MNSPSEARSFSILLVCRTYPPVLGGSEIEAQRVSAGLLRRGHKVTVLCAAGPLMPDAALWIDPEGVPVRIFGRRCRERLRDYAFALGVVRTLLTEHREYQLVYFLMQGIHVAAGLPTARWLRKPILMKISGSGLIPIMRKSWLGRTELRWLRKWAKRVMVLNPGMAEEARQAGFKPHQLLWMPNPVDTSAFAPCAPESRPILRSNLGIGAGASVVIYVGRLAPEKQLRSLIRGFSIVVRRVPSAVLVLLGDGPERPLLENLANESCPAGTVRFPGRKSGTEVRDWLQASDIFALVSSLEGLPVSLLEAMSVGLPSVVSDIPANLQLIQAGVHGLHARLLDPESIAGAMETLLLDGALRRRTGCAARVRVAETYSVQKVLERYEAMFEEALQQETDRTLN